MSKKLLLLAAILLPAFSLPTYAANGYAGLSVGDANYQESGTSLDALSLTARLGVRLNRFVEFEARMATSSNESDGTNDFRLNYLAGAYAKINVLSPASSRFSAYIIGGGTYVRVRHGTSLNPVTDNDSSVSYGLGIDLFGNEHTALNLEWMRYGDSKIGTANTDYTLDILSIGVVHHF